MKVKMFGESSLTLLHPGSIAAFRTRFRTRFGISGSVFGGKLFFQHHHNVVRLITFLSNCFKDCLVTHLCCPCAISQLALEIDDIDRAKK